jgi:nitrogen-specific signal transduction histidine kinase
MVGSMLDITERVEMQSRLELSDRMASIGTLAAGVAHEINNPLTYVLANLTVLLEELRKPDVDTFALQEVVREAQEGAERMRRIVRDLQVLSRPCEDDGQCCDVHPVFESSLSMVSNQIRHRAQVIKEYGALPAVRVNRARLGQVLVNVLVNAAQAITEGNATDNVIRIRTYTNHGGEAVLEDTDSGCGISADAQRRIFEPFFTTKAVGFGTGLGLSICHSIVTAAGGRMHAESRVGAGTTLRVSLPPAPRAATAQRPPGQDGPSLRILLVDDEPLIRRSVARLLEPHHRVVAADSGDAALTQMREQDFDLILCDLMMPTMTGMELYRRLVDEASPFASKIVFMTGGAFSRDSSEFMRTCPGPFIEKPFDRAAIARAFSSVRG